jgi:outer membrane protein OmpA-like peptidoglycan-associated protein
MELNGRLAPSRSQEDHWIPLSDLMTGLMMIFMLVAIVFMIQVKRNEVKIVAAQTKVKDLALRYTDLRAQLYQDLQSEFKDDLEKWHASISPDLSVSFHEPSIQFDINEAVVKDSFKLILTSFFPRYIAILYSPKYRDVTEEIRIEGHTSKKWGNLPEEPAYYENMRLSQARSRSVLIYVFSLPEIRTPESLKFLLERVTANGLSSAGWLQLPDGSEDVARSQRVEFRVRTNAEEQLTKILKALAQ